MDNFADLLHPTSGWHVVGLILALGAVTMALLQLLDDLTPIRNAFHLYRLREWIKQRASIYNEQRKHLPTQAGPSVTLQADLPEISVANVSALLIWQATGGTAVVFGLPIDQLIGQINAASQIALEYPRPNFPLVATLSQPIEPELPVILPSQHLASRPEGTQFADLKKLLEKEDHDRETVESDYFHARNRIGHRIQRNLDGLQIKLTNESAWLTQVLAIALSIVIALWIWRELPPVDRAPWYLVLIAAVAAGYAAPFIGDIVKAIRRLGRR